jgi:hypothetical protein
VQSFGELFRYRFWRAPFSNPLLSELSALHSLLKGVCSMNDGMDDGMASELRRIALRCPSTDGVKLTQIADRFEELMGTVGTIDEQPDKAKVG